MNAEDKAESFREAAAMTTASVPLIPHAQSGYVHAGLATRLRGVLATIEFWRERARQRRRLARLDDRMLADIGVTRAQARREARKWFWQD